MQQVDTSHASNAIVALADLKDALSNVTASMPSINTEPMLRMQKDGVFVYGSDDVEVQSGAQWAVNMLSVRHGFACWTNYEKRKNEKLGEVTVSAIEPLPLRSSLPNRTDDQGNACEWKEQYTLFLRCMNGEDEGTQVIYSTTSNGGSKAFKSLIAAVMLQLNTDEVNYIPIIELGSETYNHPHYGKTFNPLFIVKGWSPLVEVPETVAPVPATVAVSAPETAPEPTPETAPQPVAEEPRRRRRRPAAA